MEKQENKIIDKDLVGVNGGSSFGEYYSNDEMPKYVGRKIKFTWGWRGGVCWVMLESYDTSKREGVVTPCDKDAIRVLDDLVDQDINMPGRKRCKSLGNGKYLINYGRFLDTFFSDAQ